MLDKTKPYGEVCGISPARFYQLGKHYAADGAEIDIETGKPVGETQPVFSCDSVFDYGSMHHNTLKKLVMDAGGEYTGREDAVKFLKGLE